MATTTTSSSAPSKFQTEVQSMVNGLTNSVPSTLRSMLVSGTSMTIPQVLAKMQAILDMLTAVTEAKTTYQHAIATRKGELVADRTFYENVVANLKQVFGTTDQTTRVFKSARSPGQIKGHRCASVPIRVACSIDLLAAGSASPASPDE